MFYILFKVGTDRKQFRKCASDIKKKYNSL